MCCLSDVMHVLSGAYAVFTVEPGDLVVVSNVTASFNCSSNSTSSANPMFRIPYINWCNSSSDECGAQASTDTQVTVYFNDYNGNTTSSSKYSVESYNTSYGEHVRNFNILRTQPTDAGYYVCYDVNTPRAAVAKLAVIG